MPTRPAWATAATPATGSARTTGTQSAARASSTSRGSGHEGVGLRRSVGHGVQDDRVVAVHLAHRDQLPDVDPERPGQSPEVAGDQLGVAPTARTQVERRGRPLAQPAVAVGEGDPDPPDLLVEQEHRVTWSLLEEVRNVQVVVVEADRPGRARLGRRGPRHWRPPAPAVAPAVAPVRAGCPVGVAAPGPRPAARPASAPAPAPPRRPPAPAGPPVPAPGRSLDADPPDRPRDAWGCRRRSPRR
jgi:hypothetical protein